MLPANDPGDLCLPHGSHCDTWLLKTPNSTGLLSRDKARHVTHLTLLHRMLVLLLRSAALGKSPLTRLSMARRQVRHLGQPSLKGQ